MGSEMCIRDRPGASTCTSCAAGTFQSSSGETACEACTPGYYCPAGASAPLPCPGGTHMDTGLTVMTSADDCVICPRGTFCSVGSETPTDCAPGTVNPDAHQETCTTCAAGSYQPNPGATTCIDCPPGTYCPRGTAQPIPCSGGTYGNASGLENVTECRPVMAGFWAPTGSSEPIPCPGSGFFCPGRAHDHRRNTDPGSTPIPIKVGSMRVVVDGIPHQADCPVGFWVRIPASHTRHHALTFSDHLLYVLCLSAYVFSARQVRSTRAAPGTTTP